MGLEEEAARALEEERVRQRAADMERVRREQEREQERMRREQLSKSGTDELVALLRKNKVEPVRFSEWRNGKAVHTNSFVGWIIYPYRPATPGTPMLYGGGEPGTPETPGLAITVDGVAWRYIEVRGRRYLSEQVFPDRVQLVDAAKMVLAQAEERSQKLPEHSAPSRKSFWQILRGN